MPLKAQPSYPGYSRSSTDAQGARLLSFFQAFIFPEQKNFSSPSVVGHHSWAGIPSITRDMEAQRAILSEGVDPRQVLHKEKQPCVLGSVGRRSLANKERGGL
jgi:hypothetical protein